MSTDNNNNQDIPTTSSSSSNINNKNINNNNNDNRINSNQINNNNCCCHCNNSCNNNNNNNNSSSSNSHDNNNNNNLQIPENKNKTIDHSNIFINEPIPIQSGINHTMDIMNPSNISNSTTLNTIINEAVFMDKYKIIDIRPMGSGAKKGHGFQENVPQEISHLINQDEYLKFINSFNRIYNYFYLLLVPGVLLISGILFPIFISKITTLLIAVISGCSIIIFSAIIYFIINKYTKGKRISLMENKVKQFNMKMDSISVPLQFCMMKVLEAVPGRPHYSVERLIIRITYSSSISDNSQYHNNGQHNNNNINQHHNNINNNNSIGKAEC